MDSRSRTRWAVLSLMVALVAGCHYWPVVEGSGHVTAEERQLSEFTAIRVETGIDATVLVDATQPQLVRVVGDDNLVAQVRTALVGSTLSTLYVEFRDGSVRDWTSPNPLRVEVVVARLESLEGTDGSTLDVNGSITTPTFSLFSSGGGTVKARGLDVEELSLEISGGGDVSLEGRATDFTSSMSGGSELRARGLATQKATLSSSGGGSTALQVSDTLHVSASGGGEVRIVGQPAVLSKELSGGSTLEFE